MEKDIINKIIKNRDKILSNLRQEDIDKYCWIKKRFRKGDILNDSEFQFEFKKFYIMNAAGLSNKQKRRFFELLSDKESSLEYILNELYRIPTSRKTNSVQFSFATKLLHTVNNNKPIFDKMVGRIIDREVEGENKEEKIQSCIVIYKFLEKFYSTLTKNNTIKIIISKFRTTFGVNDQTISEIKVLDFMIWSLGRLE